MIVGLRQGKSKSLEHIVVPDTKGVPLRRKGIKKEEVYGKRPQANFSEAPNGQSTGGNLSHKKIMI